MKAIVYHSSFSEKIALKEVSDLSIEHDTTCLVRIEAAALNRRDQWIREGLYPGIQDDVILGSDGYGEVITGPQAWLGKKVIVNPNIHWGDDPRAQSSEYSILGMPVNGTLSEVLAVDADRLMVAPGHLHASEAAALPLAGLTAFRACYTKAKVSSNQRVLITGIGGGVSQMALLFVLATGAEVWVTSGSEEKIELAKKKGAMGGFNYRDEDWVKTASKHGLFDAIIDSAGGSSLNSYLKIIRPGGKIVMYGSTLGRTPKLDTARLFWSQSHIMGTSMGNDQEFREMVSFVTRHEIVPTIDKEYASDEFLSAFDRFRAPDHHGKIIIRF